MGHEKEEIKTECEERLKIMEKAIKKQFRANQKQETEELITKEVWGRGYQWKPHTEDRMQIEAESGRAPLTQYLDEKDIPIKQYLTSLITAKEVRIAIRQLAMKKAT